MRFSISFVFIALLVSCVKDRTDIIPSDQESEFPFNSLYVNEIVAKGSVDLNEFGIAEDWIELYNPNDTIFKIQSGKWFLTDEYKLDGQKYLLPSVEIPANGYLVIWCDGLDTVANDIHTNFKLGATGESVGLYYKDTPIDTITYPNQTVDGASYARINDGGATWVQDNSPTIHSSNN